MIFQESTCKKGSQRRKRLCDMGKCGSVTCPTYEGGGHTDPVDNYQENSKKKAKGATENDSAEDTHTNVCEGKPTAPIGNLIGSPTQATTQTMPIQDTTQVSTVMETKPTNPTKVETTTAYETESPDTSIQTEETTITVPEQSSTQITEASTAITSQTELPDITTSNDVTTMTTPEYGSTHEAEATTTPVLQTESPDTDIPTDETTITTPEYGSPQETEATTNSIDQTEPTEIPNPLETEPTATSQGPATTKMDTQPTDMTNPIEETTPSEYDTSKETSARPTTKAAKIEYRKNPSAVATGVPEKGSVKENPPYESEEYENDEYEPYQREAPNGGETTHGNSYDNKPKPETTKYEPEDETGTAKKVAGQGARTGATGGSPVRGNQVPWRKMKSITSGKRESGKRQPGLRRTRNRGKKLPQKQRFTGGGSVRNHQNKRPKSRERKQSPERERRHMRG